MGLVSAKEMLNKAVAGGYAVGHFNINNLEWTKAILQTAQELQSPVILGVSEGAAKYMCGYTTVASMVKAMLEELNITVPVALHLDHGTYEGAKKAIAAGFSSIQYDGGHAPIEENLQKTAEFVKARRTASSARASSRTPFSARPSRTWASRCWPRASATSTASTPPTGRA